MKTTTVVTFASQTTQISEPAQQQQHMTSLEIAELTGKQHKHVMEAIRKMDWLRIAISTITHSKARRNNAFIWCGRWKDAS